MEILILHRVPYTRIEYHCGIDHTQHNITYFGKQELLDTLPSELRCRTWARPGIDSVFAEACAWLDEFPQHFDRIISMSEYELLDAASLRERYAVAGSSVAQVMLTRNKILMKAAVDKAGLRVPRYLALQDFLLDPLQANWPGKTVLKPHSGASSIDVTIFATPQQAYQALIHRQSTVALLDIAEPDYSAYEIEAFVEGSIRHFDGLIQNGRILAMTSSEYIGTCLAYMESGTPLGSMQVPTTNAIRQWASRVLAAVAIRNGSFHLEAIMDEGEPTFLEVGNRVGGADVVATFKLATGIHLPSQELRIHLGEDISHDLQVPTEGDAWYSWFVFPGHQQPDHTYHGLQGIAPFRHRAEVIQWHELPIGAAMPQHITYSAHEAPLTGIIKTHSPEQSRQWLNHLFASATWPTPHPVTNPVSAVHSLVLNAGE